MSFGSDINKFKKKTEKAALMVFRGTCLDLFGRIVKRTPVGNPGEWIGEAPQGYVGGRARSNWQFAINTVNTSTTDATGGSDRPKTTTLRVGDSVYITNNLPYILPLEHGWSAQAPAGMVKVTVSEFKNIVRRNT